MSSLKFNGDLSGISEEQLGFIAKVLEDLGHKKSKATVERFGEIGDNFSASVLRIIVEKENREAVRFIVKVAPQNLRIREMMNTGAQFHNETVLYKEVFPKFSQLQKQFEIPKEERFIFPKCFGASKTVPYEVLILEDMADYGYDTKDKMVALDTETVKLVLKSFAQLHSLSYALKSQNSEAYIRITESLIHMWEAMAQAYEQGFKLMEQQVISMLDSEIAKEKCKGLIGNLPVDQLSADKTEMNKKGTVILHGDGWTTNFLFMTEGGKPKSCVMIDYQLSRSANPANDLLFMMFCCTDYETRKEHYYDWIDYYYAELEKYLSYFGIKIQSELPRNILNESLKKNARFSIAKSIIIALVTMRGYEEVPNYHKEFENSTLGEVTEKMNSNDLNQEAMARIVTRVRGTFASAFELGLL